MKVIKLKAAPRGRILSNNELKNILGGVGVKYQDCTCVLTMSDNSKKTAVLPGSADDSEDKCRSACAEACSGFAPPKEDPLNPVAPTDTLFCSGYSYKFYIGGSSET